MTADAEWRSGNAFLQANSEEAGYCNEEGSTNIEIADVFLLLRHYMTQQVDDSSYTESEAAPCARCDSWAHLASGCPSYSTPRVADDVEWANVVSRDVFLRTFCEELNDAAEWAASTPSQTHRWGKPRYAVVNAADSRGTGFLHYAAVMFRVDVDPGS